jgi:hypothetical protein
VADDHPIVRLGLCSLLGSHEGWRSAGGTVREKPWLLPDSFPRLSPGPLNVTGQSYSSKRGLLASAEPVERRWEGSHYTSHSAPQRRRSPAGEVPCLSSKPLALAG